MDEQRKSRISNFWYYHKIHVLIALVVVAVVAFTIRDCSNNVEPDMSIRGILNFYVPEQSQQALEQALYDAGMVADWNGDGEQSCSIQMLTIPEEIKTEQDMAVQMQVTLGFAAEDTVLYLVNEEFLELYDGQGMFDALDSFVAQNGVPQEACYAGPETGACIGVSLQGNQLLEQCGINTDELYLGMRMMRQNEQDDPEALEMFERSRQIAAYLYQQN